jgi:tryptophanyl-tRNA synthetase
VGKDQLPHIELTRKIARRFNARFAAKPSVFREPAALLSAGTKILGLDGNQKMSKSRGNAIMLRATPDETRELVKRAKTDTDRRITYAPETRPEVANLLLLISLCTGEDPAAIADAIGDGGGGALKKRLTDALNDTFAPVRERRNRLAEDGEAVVRSVLSRGTAEANRAAEATLAEMRRAMNMDYGL